MEPTYPLNRVMERSIKITLSVVFGVAAIALIIGLASPHQPAYEPAHSIAWHRANECVTKQTYALLDKGYSADEARVGAVMNCHDEIDLADHEEKLQGFANPNHEEIK
jgi:hypothetical protein